MYNVNKLLSMFELLAMFVLLLDEHKLIEKNTLARKPTFLIKRQGTMNRYNKGTVTRREKHKSRTKYKEEGN